MYIPLPELFTKRLGKIILLAFLVVGFVFLLPKDGVWTLTWLPPTWAEVLYSIGLALIVAGALGLTVDTVLKNSLARDAVSHALGYLLPTEIREEMRWLYEFELLGVEHRSDYTLTLIAEDAVLMRGRTHRVFRNITNHATDLRVSLGVDEWFRSEGQSQVCSVSYRIGKGQMKEVPIKYKPGGREDLSTLTIEGKTALVPPYATAEVITEFIEIKRRTDLHIAVYSTPTQNPVITIDADPSLRYRVVFAHRAQAELRESPDGKTFRLDGVLLPLQHIAIKWWDEQQHAEWKDAIAGRPTPPSADKP